MFFNLLRENAAQLLLLLRVSDVLLFAEFDGQVICSVAWVHLDFLLALRQVYVYNHLWLLTDQPIRLSHHADWFVVISGECLFEAVESRRLLIYPRGEFDVPPPVWCLDLLQPSFRGRLSRAFIISAE